MIRRLMLVLLAVLWTGLAHADVFRPAYLELTEQADGHFDVLWKVPAVGPDRLAAWVALPERALTVQEPRSVHTGEAWVDRWTVAFPDGLAGQTLSIQGRAVGVTDVLARVQWQDGSVQVERLPVDAPTFVVQAPLGPGGIAWTYLVLGVEHILAGVDHLLFVLALLLILRTPGRLIGTLTAFTVAHSLTLGLAALGMVQVPGPPVEAMIALSIAFVAAEILAEGKGRPGLTARAPWVVALSFGLLHGLGFAGALADVGLPANAVPLALLTFNVGVEIGQVLFVGAVGLVVALAGRVGVPSRPWMRASLAYGLGTVAAFWTVERVVGFWGP